MSPREQADERLPLYIEGPQLIERLEDLTAAIRHLALLRVAARHLPGLIEQAEAAADAAALASIPDPRPEVVEAARLAAESPRVASGSRGGRPLAPLTKAALAVIEMAHPAPATLADIVAATGQDLQRVRQRLYSLETGGRITCDRTVDPQLWRLATPEPTPLERALLGAAGEDVA